MAYQFPAAAGILAVAGCVVMWRSREPWDRLVLTTIAAFFGWALMTRIPDVFNAFVFAYAAIAPTIGVGCSSIAGRHSGSLTTVTAALLVAHLAVIGVERVTRVDGTIVRVHVRIHCRPRLDVTAVHIREDPGERDEERHACRQGTGAASAVPTVGARFSSPEIAFRPSRVTEHCRSPGMAVPAVNSPCRSVGSLASPSPSHQANAC